MTGKSLGARGLDFGRQDRREIGTSRKLSQVWQSEQAFFNDHQRQYSTIKMTVARRQQQRPLEDARIGPLWLALFGLSLCSFGGLQLSIATAGGERPKLVQLVAAEQGYSENSSVNLLCSAVQGQHESLGFEWFHDGQLLELASSGGGGAPKAAGWPQIERHQDHSLLRIGRVQLHHAGRYTCTARNHFGQDSSSVQLRVNGKPPV